MDSNADRKSPLRITWAAMRLHSVEDTSRGANIGQGDEIANVGEGRVLGYTTRDFRV